MIFYKFFFKLSVSKLKMFFTIIFIFFFINVNFAEDKYNVFNLTRTSKESVTWSPESGVYYNSIYLSLKSNYGKIFYLVGNSLNSSEPYEYKNEIFLKGQDGQITDYDIIVILEQEDGRIELFSRSYRIDRTDKLQKKYYKKKEYYTKETFSSDNTITNSIKLKYTFDSKRYKVDYKEREFDYPQSLQNNDSKIKFITLTGNKKKDSVFLTPVTYIKEDNIYTEIQSYIIKKKGIQPPSFGSLYWGQIYKQHYRVRIKANSKDDIVYYWFKEWKNDENVYAPPLTSNLKEWTHYEGPIELISKYGKDGICGIAGLSMNVNGEVSEIAGPYYFKVMDIDKTFKQEFENETNQQKYSKKIFLNGYPLNKNSLKFNGKAILRFEHFNNSQQFYFVFKSKNHIGLSEFLPCNEEYIFNNTEVMPVKFSLYYSNGEEIGKFWLNNKNMILPIPASQSGYYFNSTQDTVFNFYMPTNIVRYSISNDIKKHLEITGESKLFEGAFKLTTKPNSDITYKVKFGAFDKNNNIIGESKSYYFRIDKKSPAKDVLSKGVDFTIAHNDKQILTLIPPEQDVKIFYKINKNGPWILYTSPILFDSPITGEYSVSVYVKSVDLAGNERINKEPFVVRFDKRGLFVDSTKNFSGNGTQSSPYNSIERAIAVANEKKVKIIYILSTDVKISSPINVKSDIIIQPFQQGLRPSVVLKTKSIWHTSQIWFLVGGDGYLEFRNIDFSIDGGNNFAYLKNTKMKIYNTNFFYTGNDDFTLIKNSGGAIGLYNVSFNVTNNPKNVTFLNLAFCDSYMKNIKAHIVADSILLLKLDKMKSFTFQNMQLNLTVNNDVKFSQIEESDILINKVICNIEGNYKTALLFENKNTNLYIKNSDFVLNGSSPFNTQVLKQYTSETKVVNSLVRINNSNSVIGFHSYENSILYFNNSMLDIHNALEYSYGFRVDKSKLFMNSSILRNINCNESVSCVINEGSFKGINNSIFNIDTIGRSFNFWVTKGGDVTTANSFYYFNKNDAECAFLYLNNFDYKSFKPKWYANVISTNVLLYENLTQKDRNYIVKDFTEKNIYYNFTKEFDVKSKNFFIPLTDCPLLQGGLSEDSSPLSIPKVDFLGNTRILPGIGIDIGAIQKSGNF